MDWSDDLPYRLDAMMEVAQSRHGALETRAVDFGHFTKKFRIFATEEREGEYYYDVIQDLTLFFGMGLEVGGLACQILQNDTWENLRANCHQSVDDASLRRTIAFVHEHLSTNREDNTITICAKTWQSSMMSKPMISNIIADRSG